MGHFELYIQIVQTERERYSKYPCDFEGLLERLGYSVSAVPVKGPIQHPRIFFGNGILGYIALIPSFPDEGKLEMGISPSSNKTEDQQRAVNELLLQLPMFAKQESK